MSGGDDRRRSDRVPKGLTESVGGLDAIVLASGLAGLLFGGACVVFTATECSFAIHGGEEDEAGGAVGLGKP